MKTQLKTEKWTAFDYRCDAIIGDESSPDYYETAKPCSGFLDTNGVCQDCGKQGKSHEYTSKSGIAYYQVNVEGETAKFSAEYNDSDNGPTGEYNRKLIAAIKRAGGSGNGVWMDSCKNPDGCNGTFGWYLSQKRGGGFSCNERFSIEMI